MKGKCQWRAEIPVKASSSKLWTVVDDVSLLPKYHPEVGRVDLLSGRKNREVGVKYRCNVFEGRKGNCVEEVVAYTPGVSFSTSTPEDSWGIGQMMSDLVVDTIVTPTEDNTSILSFVAYYNPVGPINFLLNTFMLRRVMKKRALLVMHGTRRLAEEA